MSKTSNKGLRSKLQSQKAVQTIVRQLRCLTELERVKVINKIFDKFCTYCGSQNHRCKCWKLDH